VHVMRCDMIWTSHMHSFHYEIFYLQAGLTLQIVRPTLCTVQRTIAPVSKQTLFIRDLLLIGCFTLSGDSALLVGYGKPTLL